MPYRQPSRTAWVNVLFWKIGRASSIIERVKAKNGVMTSAISKKLFPDCLACLRFLSRFNYTTPNSDNSVDRGVMLLDGDLRGVQAFTLVQNIRSVAIRFNTWVIIDSYC